MASSPRVIEAEERVEDPEIVWVSPEDGRRMFDEAARKWLGISGDEFFRRYDAGASADMVESEDNRHVVDLYLLIPFARSFRGVDRGKPSDVTIDVASMSHTEDRDHLRRIVYVVDDAIPSDAQTIRAAAAQAGRSTLPSNLGQHVFEGPGWFPYPLVRHCQIEEILSRERIVRQSLQKRGASMSRERLEGDSDGIRSRCFHVRSSS